MGVPRGTGCRGRRRNFSWLTAVPANATSTLTLIRQRHLLDAAIAFARRQERREDAARVDLRPDNWSSSHGRPTAPGRRGKHSVCVSLDPRSRASANYGPRPAAAAQFPKLRGSESGEGPSSNGQDDCALWSVGGAYIRSSVIMPGFRSTGVLPYSIEMMSLPESLSTTVLYDVLG